MNFISPHVTEHHKIIQNMSIAVQRWNEVELISDKNNLEISNSATNPRHSKIHIPR